MTGAPILIVVGGLPATGKSTVASAPARQTGFTFVRVDRTEQADRIWTGNAAGWRAPGGLRFDYVHILLDCVPAARRADLVRHHLSRTVRRARAACWSATMPPTRSRAIRPPPRR